MKQRILLFLTALMLSASQSLWAAYTVTVDPSMATSTGTIAVDKTSCESGETVTVTPSPAAGYAIDYVKYLGEDYQEIATIAPVDGVYSFTMPDKNVVVTAAFKKLLTSADITISSIPDQTYTGEPLEPAVTINDSEGEGNIADLCDITYSNNINAGTATVTIKAKEEEFYAGETTTTFQIVAKTVTSPTITLSATSAAYNGQDQKPTVTAVKDGNTAISNTEYSVSYKKDAAVVNQCILPGEYTVVITDVDGGNYIVSGSTTFTITGKIDPDVTAPKAIDNLVYNGQPQALIEAGKCPEGTKMLYKIYEGPESETEWSEEIPKATKAVAYGILWKVEGNDIYNSTEEKDLGVAIAKAEITKVELDKTELTLEQYKAQKPKVTKVYAGENSALVVDAEWYEVEYPFVVNQPDEYEVKVSAIDKDDQNFTGSATATFKIAKLDPDVTAPKAIEGLVYNGQPQALVTPGKCPEGTTMLYKISTNRISGTAWSEEIPKATDAGSYNIAWKVEGFDMYNSIQGNEFANIYPSVKSRWGMITGPSDATKGMLKTGGTICIPTTTEDGQQVTGIADGAFADAKDNVTFVIKGVSKSFTVGQNATGEGNVETSAQELDDMAKQPNLLETLKKGKIFAWLDNFALMTYSSGIDVKIPATVKIDTTVTKIIDSVITDPQKRQLAMNYIGNDTRIMISFETSDYLQPYKCNVENTLTQGHVVSVSSLNKDMWNETDKAFIYTANNGILLACDTTRLMKFAEHCVDSLITKWNLTIFANLLKPKVVSFITDHRAKLVAEYNGKKTATGDAQTYSPNMLVPVVEAYNYKNDDQYTYYALTYNALSKKYEFVKIADNSSKTPEGRALLKVPTSMAKASSRSLTIITDDGEGTTKIAPAIVEMESDVWYNLSGQRIEKPTRKGLYIHNGRKEVVK